MNVRIFWVRAMKCMCAQTRPRFILSSEGVFGGMEFEPMLTPREKSPLPENVPWGGSNPWHCGQRAQALPTELFRPLIHMLLIWSKISLLFKAKSDKNVVFDTNPAIFPLFVQHGLGEGCTGTSAMCITNRHVSDGSVHTVSFSEVWVLGIDVGQLYGHQILYLSTITRTSESLRWLETAFRDIRKIDVYKFILM